MKFYTNETGIFDHRKLIYPFLKSTYAKKNFKCKCFKNFHKKLFKKNLSKNHKNFGNLFEVFYDTFTNTLDCYAALKKKKLALIITNL